VAAPGPSLLGAVGSIVASGLPVIVVNDAWRALPNADVLYAVDNAWWIHHRGVPAFKGERWAAHESLARAQHGNDKSEIAERYGLYCVLGCAHSDGFSFDPFRIAYGSNSGFQAINLAILFGCERIALCGFDMHGTSHFFGDHPDAIMGVDTQRKRDFSRFVKYFDAAARTLPAHIQIINVTPGSTLRCFPIMSLEDGLANCRLHRDRTLAHAAAG